jgi:hypothetical protein
VFGADFIGSEFFALVAEGWVEGFHIGSSILSRAGIAAPFRSFLRSCRTSRTMYKMNLRRLHLFQQRHLSNRERLSGRNMGVSEYLPSRKERLMQLMQKGGRRPAKRLD